MHLDEKRPLDDVVLDVLVPQSRTDSLAHVDTLAVN